MASPMSPTKTLAIAVSIAACLLGAVAVPPAFGGTIWVTDGNMNAGQTGGCNAFGVYGDLSAFYVPSACPMSLEGGGVVPQGQNAFWMTTAPPGVVINSAWTADGDVSVSNMTGSGFIVGDFWRDINSGAYGGSTLGANQRWFNTGLEGSSNINSQIYGIQLLCIQNVYNGGCPGAGSFTVGGVELSGTETSLPSVSGGGSLWGNASYVWNPAGDPWPVTLYASDVSGICSSTAYVGGVQLNGPIEPRDSTVWQQCPNPVSWSFSVDTRSQLPTTGSLPISLSATNAAGNAASPANQVTAGSTVSVDNIPVGVSFRTPNDPNPSVWTGHAVTVDATGSAGPSGVGGVNCAVDRGSAKAYPARGLAVDGDGTHTVTCTAWNNAVGPQGQHNTGSSAVSVHIDEAPPSVNFQPQTPSDPTGLVVNTSDGESGVASGSLEMAAAGSGAWTNLPASFDGVHLLAHLDDSGLRGPYTMRATSCDNVGNCTTTSETLSMPLRLGAASDVGFAKIGSPAKVVRKRVLVGFRYRRERRHGRIVRVKTGGHYRTVRLVIHANTRCGHKLVKTGPRRWREISVCRRLGLHVVTSTRVPYGKPFKVHGLLITNQGVPLAGVPVSILTSPDNGFNQFTAAASATTDTTGAWTATLPAGPSRTIRAVYGGSATVLPAAGQASVKVPAKIQLSVSSRTVSWSGVLVLHGHLVGGYVPADGVALRLLIRLPGRSRPYEPIPFRTDAAGNFSIRWTWGRGFGIVTYPFAIATTATESDFPFAASRSRWIRVTFGPPTRRRRQKKEHNHPKHVHHHRHRGSS